MALILNLETSTTNCSVSLARDGKILVVKEHNTPNYSHSEQLHVFIQDVMEQSALSLDNLDAIAISKGPGSYTGLRIGVSAAKGLCFSLDIPLISIPTLENMVAQISTGSDDFIIPVLDARRMEVYSAVFDNSLKEIKETRAEIVNELSFQEFVKKGNVLIIGSGAEKCKEPLKDSKKISFDTTIIPSAREMGRLSYHKFISKDFEDVAYFEPYYLKDFILQGKK